MSYTLKYDDSNPADRERALQDVKNWFGEDRYNQACERIRNLATLPTRKQFRVIAAFGGVCGFPVEVWADELGIAKADSKHQVDTEQTL